MTDQQSTPQDNTPPAETAPTPTTLATPAESVGLAVRLLADALNVPVDELAWIRLVVEGGQVRVSIAKSDRGQLVGVSAGPFETAQVSE